MKKAMYFISFISVLVTIVSAFLYSFYEVVVAKLVAITFATIAYHFLMRLAVGLAFDVFMKNQVDYSRKWYQCKPYEIKLYERLNVKHWKGKMPSYNTDYFNPKKHSWSEIAQAMCQAELVHEVIIISNFPHEK